MNTTTSLLILLLIKSYVVHSENTSTDGIFFCNCISPHSYQCTTINYNTTSKWLIFNDTLSTMNNLYKMNIYSAGDTKNLLKSIFRIYKYINDFSISDSKPYLEITEKKFENASELKKLKLSRNQIMTLNVKMFKTMRKIESFDVSGNLIQVLDPMIFKGLENLKNISFAGNLLLTIEIGTFDNLQLISLCLSENKLTDFHFQYLNVSNDIMLYFNNLGDITDNSSINDFDVKELKLSYNEMTRLNPKFLKHFKKLEILNVHNNLIEYIQSDTFEGLNNLKEITLYRNKIFMIEKGTFYNLNLSYLGLDHNRLVEFDFYNLTSIVISICDNLLTSLKINGNVEEVYASNNNISTVDIVTRTLKNLNTDNNSEAIQINYI